MLALTVSLGVWQVERLAWKTQLLEGIHRAELSPPAPLEAQPEAFRRVMAEGTFLPMVVLYGAEVRSGLNGPVMGAQVISPFCQPGRLPVLVDRGWAPLDAIADPPVGHQRIEGYVRAPDHASWMSPRDDAPRRRFFTLDPKVIGQALGLSSVAPFTLVALGTPTPMLQPATTLPRPPNDHLSYAVTWFSLSLALTVIFALFVRQALRQRAAL